ncbi:hypothetical protein GJ496_006887 [Pomphorhynchus laevis]|nr:hypothetical protein GJ496_006887 [Pomphorhynchus laevis]
MRLRSIIKCIQLRNIIKFITICAFILYILCSLNMNLIEKPSISDNYLASLENTVIIVRTAHQFHCSRAQAIYNTWYNLTLEKMHIITDKYDKNIFSMFKNAHTCHCPSGHELISLCCRAICEFDLFIREVKKKKFPPLWLCRFDDDQYVHVPRLIKMLNYYNPAEHHYLGKFSWPPIKVNISRKTKSGVVRFHTYGAGVCFSAPTALMLIRFLNRDNLVNRCKMWKMGDDVAIGRIVNTLLNIDSEEIEKFHSHLKRTQFEHLQDIFKSKNKTLLEEAITFGFDEYTLFDSTINHSVFHQMQALHKYFYP